MFQDVNIWYSSNLQKAGSPYRDTVRTWMGIISELGNLIRDGTVKLPELKERDEGGDFDDLGDLEETA